MSLAIFNEPFVEAAASFFSINQANLPEGDFADSRYSVDIKGSPENSIYSFTVLDSQPVGGPPPEGSSVAARFVQDARLVLQHAGIEYYDSSLPTGPSLTLTGAGITLETEVEGIHLADGVQTAPRFGTELAVRAAPPGEDELKLVLRVDFDPTGDPGATVVDYPLLDGGRNWDSGRDMITPGPMLLGGEGYLSRWEGIKRRYIKLATEVKTHGVVGIEMLQALGIPDDRIGIDRNLGYGLQAGLELPCNLLLDEARRVFLAAGHLLLENGNGVIITRPIAPVDEPPVLEIDIARLESSEVTARISTQTKQVPLCIRVEGSKPVIPELADGYVTKTELISRTVRPVVLEAAKFVQRSDGVIVAISGSDFTGTIVTDEVWVQEIFFKGCIQTRVRETWGLFNPERERYITENPSSPTGLPYTYPGPASIFIFGDAPVTDDSAPARQFRFARLLPILQEREDFIYDEESTTGGGTTAFVVGTTGALVKTIKSTGEWRSLEKALKFKTGPGTNWDLEDVRASMSLFGDKRPFDQAGGGGQQELFYRGPFSPTLARTTGSGFIAPGGGRGARTKARWSSQTTVDNTLLEGLESEGRRTAFVEKLVETEEAFARTVGGTSFQFSDGGESRDGVEQGQVVRTTTKPFTPQSKQTHGSVATTIRNNPRDNETRFLNNLPGWLPPATFCTIEDIANEESQPIEGEHCLSVGNWTPRTETQRFEFGVERASAATALARDMHRVVSAHSIDFSLPINPVLRANAPIRFRDMRHDAGKIDPAAYPHLSNAWIESCSIRTIHDSKGRIVKRIVAGVIRLPII